MTPEMDSTQNFDKKRCIMHHNSKLENLLILSAKPSLYLEYCPNQKTIKIMASATRTIQRLLNFLKGKEY